MEASHLKTLETFDINSLPNLDVVVLGALERFSQETLPHFDVASFGNKPLVIGSANAHATGKILFGDVPAVFAEESDYQEKLHTYTDCDSVVIVSASGSKHAVTIATELADLNLPVWLLTNNPHAPAAAFVDAARVLVFPKNREPYTYNTSTYLSMIVSKTKENSSDVYDHLMKVEGAISTNLGEYSSFMITIPNELEALRYMFRTKFEELFGGRVCGRVFTHEEAKHAKTLVPSEKELFIHFGDGAELFPEKKEKTSIPLPNTSGYGGTLALGYFVIGKIQASHPPYFAENAVEYCEQASKIFGQEIKPIVD